ncbi:MAG: prephenate dehydrogenase/arogenate dehydrogenase family protein [Anaerolineae bacterium]
MSLTIVGLGVLGTLLGMALKSAVQGLVIVGHDPDAQRVAEARKLGAIDKSHWNLPSACEQSDIVVLDLPFDQIELTLRVLAATMAVDSLVLDIGIDKRATLACAARVLPVTVQYIGGRIVPLSATFDTQAPSAGALKNATFYLVTPPTASERAIKLAVGLAEAAGAKPCFVTAEELDSLTAAGSQLPLVAACALMAAWQTTDGWRDRQRALGTEAMWVQHLISSTPDGQIAALWENRDFIRGWLDRYIAALQAWRGLLNEQDATRLVTAFAEVKRGVEAAARADEGTALPDSSELSGLRQLLMGSLGQRLRGKR